MKKTMYLIDFISNPLFWSLLVKEEKAKFFFLINHHRSVTYLIRSLR